MDKSNFNDRFTIENKHFSGVVKEKEYAVLKPANSDMNIVLTDPKELAKLIDMLKKMHKKLKGNRNNKRWKPNN